MEKANLAFLRYWAFWNEVSKPLQQDSPNHPPRILTLMDPNVREVNTALDKDFQKKFKIVKVSDVN